MGEFDAFCAVITEKNPPHNLMPHQVTQVVQGFHRGLKCREIASEVGVPNFQVLRCTHAEGLSFYGQSKIYYKNRVDEVREVLEYYRTHTRKETEEFFKDKKIKLRSITKKQNNLDIVYEPKMRPITGRELILLLRMGGLLSFARQAEILKRPTAHAGSIAILQKRHFNFPIRKLHGLLFSDAKIICVHADVRKRMTRRPIFHRARISNGNQTKQDSPVILWQDVCDTLRPWVPEATRTGIDAMIDFQKWLYQTDDPRKVIHFILREKTLPRHLM